MKQDESGCKRLCVALVAFLILSIVGTVITVELTDVWVRSRMDPDYQSFCAVSKGMNCETVAMSDYSSFLGGPVSVWATSGYLFVIILTLLCLVRIKDGFGRGFLFLFSALFMVVSLLLIYIMKFEIKSLCILCLAVDAVNLGLLAMAVLAIKMPGDRIWATIKYDFESLWKRPALPAILAVVGVASLAGAYLYGNRLAKANEELHAHDGSEEEFLDSPGEWTSKVHGEQCGDECGCSEESDHPQALQMGVNEDGHNWLGARDSQFIIQEFTDYECPYCRKAHMMVRKLLSNNPGKVKVFHRHYPLDQACNRKVPSAFHQRACEFSRIAICAGRQGRFWEMNDFLFQHSKEIRTEKLSATEVAKRLELDAEEFECCMADDRVVDEIKADIEDGISYKLKGTPAFIIDGNVYYGKIPDEAVQQLK